MWGSANRTKRPSLIVGGVKERRDISMRREHFGKTVGRWGSTERIDPRLLAGKKENTEERGMKPLTLVQGEECAPKHPSTNACELGRINGEPGGWFILGEREEVDGIQVLGGTNGMRRRIGARGR